MRQVKMGILGGMVADGMICATPTFAIPYAPLHARLLARSGLAAKAAAGVLLYRA